MSVNRLALLLTFSWLPFCIPHPPLPHQAHHDWICHEPLPPPKPGRGWYRALQTPELGTKSTLWELLSSIIDPDTVQTWGLSSRIQFEHFSNGSSEKTTKTAFHGRGTDSTFPLGDHWAESFWTTGYLSSKLESFPSLPGSKGCGRLRLLSWMLIRRHGYSSSEIKSQNTPVWKSSATSSSPGWSLCQPGYHPDW